ncbi:MAG: PLP-dependent aspartate aminotransferase family protein [Myxococcota bacterium]|nr:PLP-dependent aspartate aminotransferase family protein [Myxococcota bacterium]
MAAHLSTRGVHSGRDDLNDLGVHALPLDFSTTYPLSDLHAGRDDLARMAHGGHPEKSPVYARLYNPTVGRFERAMANLESAAEAVAFGTGMAALTACLFAAQQRGSHVVAVRPLYGGSDHLLNSGLFKLDVTWATPETLADHIRPETSLIILETPANPTLRLTDIEQVVQASKGVAVLVDSTFATPVLQRPIEHGATLVLHSATKFLGGHGDAMGGVVTTNSDWATSLRGVRVATGALLHPMGAYMLHRGLQTLAMRVERAQSSAKEIALRLMEHASVERVFYPGIRSCDPTGLVGSQMSGPGSMLAFTLRGGFEEAAQVMESVTLFTAAVSLGSSDSLIQHPAGLTHLVVDEEISDEVGISASMLRLSIGLEAPEDLWKDLSKALPSHRSACQNTRPAPRQSLQETFLSAS